MSKRTHILSVRASNVKCVREVEINEVGDILEIRGDSGQGKTTILQTIEAGLRGMDPGMVRNGADAAEITLSLSTAKVNRIVRANGDTDTLTVTGMDGKPIKKAKEFLKALCGPQVFRPVEWVRLGGGEDKGRTERLRAQRDQLLSAMPLTLTPQEATDAVMALGEDVADALREVSLDGVDWSGHALVVCEALKTACYEYRKIQNAKSEDAAGALQHMEIPDKPAPRTSLAECRQAESQAMRHYHEASGALTGQQASQTRLDVLSARVAKDDDDLPRLTTITAAIERETDGMKDDRGRIERLRAELRKMEDSIDERSRKLSSLAHDKVLIEAHEARKAELAELRESLGKQTISAEEVERRRLFMASAAEASKARETQDRYEQAAESSAKARDYAERFSKLVELFRDSLPRELVSRMEMPVPGLSVDGEMIKIHGVPLHQLGTSEQIRIGVSIAAALNPATGFILVDSAESMGRGDRLALAESAGELGLQLILTIVDPDAEPSDGCVVMRGGKMVAS